MIASRKFQLTLAGLAVFGLQIWQLGRPSMWADEVATVAASTRPLHSLLRMMQFIDAVHGTYYILIHFLGKLIGYGPFALRLPSAVAVTAAVLLTFVLARKLFGERLAWFALVVAAFLPRLTWAATEARSYGIVAFLGVALTLIFVLALTSETDRTAKRYWVAYTATLILAIHFFVYLALLAGSQGVWLLLVRRKGFPRWLTAVGISIVVSAYILVWVIMEKGQVGWLPPLGKDTLNEIFIGQAFWSNPQLALLANGLILAVLAGASHRGKAVPAEEIRVMWLLGLGIVVPPLVILAASIRGGSIYDSRYFTFAAPLVAILLALALERLFSRRLAYLALAVVVALAVPSYFDFRALNAKGTYWGQIAAQVRIHSKPGDAILFTDYARKSPSLSRISIAYPADFANTTDLTVVTPYRQAIGLYPKRMPVPNAVSAIGARSRVLVLQQNTELVEYHAIAGLLKAKGFHQSQRYRAFDTWLRVFTR